jgi:hypothetical protein
LANLRTAAQRSQAPPLLHLPVVSGSKINITRAKQSSTIPKEAKTPRVELGNLRAR